MNIFILYAIFGCIPVFLTQEPISKYFLIAQAVSLVIGVIVDFKK